MRLQACIDAMGSIIANNGNDIDKNGLLLLCQLPCGSDTKVYIQLLEHLRLMKDDPTIALLTFKSGQDDVTFESLYNKAETDKRPEV